MRFFKTILTLLIITGPLLLNAQNVTLVNSNLPIVVINTNGATIPDEPKARAHMGIISNSDGKDNNIHGSFEGYDGNIAIEVRGSSSQMFEKKSYGLELRDEAWADMDASLLGMPEEEDWILYGPYMDKSLLRNVVTFTLDATLGHYSPKCRYVELVLNNEYKGLYVLMEKVKRDKNRVNIARLRMEDTEGEELTGGYIFKLDKSTGEG
ncbi:MAG: CotH kinase family protein, partial [Mariniphaga sp.]|nr:CotH kinase family protein [Mariniphaga sp.]